MPLREKKKIKHGFAGDFEESSSVNSERKAIGKVKHIQLISGEIF